MYFVTSVVSGSHSFSHPGEALRYATALRASGEAAISIRDDQGNHIGGDDLAYCCRTGMMQHNLKPELRARAARAACQLDKTAKEIMLACPLPFGIAEMEASGYCSDRNKT